MRYLKRLFKKDNIHGNNLQIYEIELIEYQNIFNSNKFFNISHIQSPGYYLNNEKKYYLKICQNSDISAIAILLGKSYFYNLLKLIRLNDVH